MGKGDQRSRRGKIWRGTFGKRRPKKIRHAAAASVTAPAEEKKGRARKEADTGEAAASDA
ncbi:MAG TPA: 30S ribosomal protein THX [Pyrinomonadaceae bacterium]|nr:30S ribosomal protein THX [Pyrinomonadaceae bacterium]